jgi:ribosomal RNA methyltransferase Nop2
MGVGDTSSCCMVYSTCSVSIYENEDVIQYALNKRDIQIMDTGMTFGVDGYTKYNHIRYHPSMKLCKRYYPHTYNMDGFFICKIKKLSNKKKDHVVDNNINDHDNDDSRHVESVSMDKNTTRGIPKEDGSKVNRDTLSNPKKNALPTTHDHSDMNRSSSKNTNPDKNNAPNKKQKKSNETITKTTTTSTTTSNKANTVPKKKKTSSNAKVTKPRRLKPKKADVDQV